MAIRDPKRGGGRFDEADRLPWLEAVEERDDQIVGQVRRRFLLIVGAIIILALFGSLILYAYNKGQEAGASGRIDEPPLVLAQDGPSKVQPNSRGGIDVPDQDRLVFDRITGTDSSGNENVGASPEQPITLPPSTQTQGSQADASGAATTQPAQTQTQGQTQTQTPAQTQTQTPAQSVVVPVQMPADDIETNTSSQNSGVREIIPANAWRIQLGAFGSARSSEIAWDQLQARFPAVLGALSLEVEPLTRPGSPDLYRMRGGPFNSRAGADRACATLRAAGQGCFVVVPR